MFKIFCLAAFIIALSCESFSQDKGLKQDVEEIRLPTGNVSATKIGDEVFVLITGGVEVKRPPSKDRPRDDNRGTYTVLSALLEKRKPFKTLTVGISSFGGNLDAAYKIQSDLEQLQQSGIKLVTYIPDFGACASACLPIFLAANSDNRFAGQTARIAVHACSSEILCDRKVTSEYIDNLVAHGLSKEWRVKNSGLFADDKATVLTKTQLLSSKMIKYFHAPTGWDKVDSLSGFQLPNRQEAIQLYESFNTRNKGL